MLKEFTQWLGNNSALAVDTDLFAGAWHRTSPDTSTVVRETGGNPDPAVRTTFSKSFQVISRALTVQQARAQNHIAFAAINIHGPVTLPVVDSGETWQVQSLIPLQNPNYFGMDVEGKGDRHYYGFNVRFPYVQDVSP